MSERRAGDSARRIAPQGLELRHLRYLVAVADAGTFTQAAEQMFIAQPTLSQQIRRLEEMVGAPLLHRLREGVRPTAAGTVLLEESRTLLSLVDHGVRRTRQAAGLGRSLLRMAIPPGLPGALAAKLLKNGTLKTYQGFPHGMPATEAETVNADLLAFLRA